MLAAGLALRCAESGGPGLDHYVIVRAAGLDVGERIEGQMASLFLQRHIGDDRLLDDPPLGARFHHAVKFNLNDWDMLADANRQEFLIRPGHAKR